MSVQEKFAEIQKRIVDACRKANRSPDEINVIAVTKYVSLETAKEAIQAGISHIGENREEGFLSKYNEIDANVTWHFIGTLQSKKVKNIIHKIDYLHSLDRLSLAEEIQKRSEHIVNCFVQVNTSGEDSKHGLPDKDLIPFINTIQNYDRIRVVGLMTMAPFTEDEVILRNCFKRLKELQKSVQALQIINVPCTELSMGMSNDFDIAIEEGSTFIRIGTSLVGKEF
ncbi:YggS family pyridoxal phosphate-dependent enzyme [Bacillus salitolerans]|uniref:Pyridoxal phosphate homeostasis protein n=1 Tax=Bacillus salitolerans TaxID=1437434 RepID=A0ABW4LL04_9BACI